MAETIKLAKYFDNKNIVSKEDQLELKPSAKGLLKLKKTLGINDWEMLYIGDGHDDYLAAKGANTFFALIAQGLVKEIPTIAEMKRDPDYGADSVKVGKTKIPKFLVAFNYGDLAWWFREVPDFRKKIKAVCFDLGDTLVLGGREEAYSLTDKNWPTWEVDRLLEEKKVRKDLKEAIFNLKIENNWRKLGDLPAMNSSEIRVAAYFLLNLFGLKEKDLVTVLYSELDKDLKKTAESLAGKMDFALNLETVPKGTTIKDLATLFPPQQFSLFIAAGLVRSLKENKQKAKLDEIVIALHSASIWIDYYRKHEVDAYRKYCKIPRGLKEFLDLLVKKKKKLAIYTSKNRKIVETALAYDKQVAAK